MPATVLPSNQVFHVERNGDVHSLNMGILFTAYLDFYLIDFVFDLQLICLHICANYCEFVFSDYVIISLYGFDNAGR